MNFFAFSSLLTAVIPLFLSLIIISFGRSKIHRVWALCALAISIWGFGTYLVAGANSPKSALFGWRVAFSGALYISVFFYHTVCIFGNLSRKKTLFLVYAQAIFFHVLSITTDKVFTNWHIVFDSLYYNTATSWYFATATGWLVVVVLGHYELWKIYRESSSFRKIQTIYLLSGFFIGFVGGFLCLLPAFGINFYPSTSVSGALYALIVTYAIFKYRLMDVKVVITRVGIFVFVYALVLGIPFWIGYTTKSWFFATSLAAVLATFGPFVYGYLRRHAEQIILKEQHAYQQALRELSETMTHIRDLDKLIKTIATEVVELVKVKFVLIYVKDELHKTFRFKYGYPGKIQGNFLKSISLDSLLAKRLDSNKRPVFGEEAGVLENIGIETGMVVPLFAEDGLLGFMFLGPKQGDRVYTSDDVLVFETLSYSTSLAMENCRFWKEIEERQRFARVQEMNTFSYSLAHEIDNPMTIIIGQANLLKKFFLKEVVMPPEKQREAEEELGYILEAAWRVSGMVDAIQDLGQRSSGEFSLLKINEVVDSFCKLYLPIFRSSSVYFTKDVPEDLPYVRGVKAELMQILVIFSNNAIHAMLARRDKEKKASLKVELRDSEWIRISMTDNGYGITPEKLEIIFAPFVTSKASTEGTGMGLYNAKKIIERHKGRIWAESDGDDLGATFIVEVPIAKDVSPAELKGKEFKGRVLFGFEDGGENGK
jgi:signal transduction histidine kinase